MFYTEEPEQLYLTPFEELDLRTTRMLIHKIVKRGRLTVDEERELNYLTSHEMYLLEKSHERYLKYYSHISDE
jgi:hypothetical protein